MGGRGASSGMTGSNIQRVYSIDESKYSGYAKTLASEANEALANDSEGKWLAYTSDTSNGQSFIVYSLEDNYIAALGSTNQGAGGSKLLASALEDIHKRGNDKKPAEWITYEKSARNFYDHIGLRKYRKYETSDTFYVPRSDLLKVANKLKKR